MFLVIIVFGYQLGNVFGYQLGSETAFIHSYFLGDFYIAKGFFFLRLLHLKIILLKGTLPLS